MRQIVLDTETTGLEPEQGHRVIEIGCVELFNRRLTGNHYHQYLQPDREIDAGAEAVHGISNDFLRDKPRFADITQDFLEFIRGAELIIHNAPFDLGFLNSELERVQAVDMRIERLCSVIDTLEMARQLHPGQRNSLDALCKRYSVDNSQRTLHGALLDAEILADVYLAMTGGQASLVLDRLPAKKREKQQRMIGQEGVLPLPSLRVIQADAAELSAHQAFLELVDKSSGGKCIWQKQSPEAG